MLSFLVSPLSVLLVAVYQLINIRIDPFGSRGIITTPRCFGACGATWVIALCPAVLSAYFPNAEVRVTLFALFTAIVVITTGICYVLISRSITQSLVGESDRQARHKENRKVLRTFGLVYGSTFVSWLITILLVATRSGLGASGCLFVLLFAPEVMVTTLNWYSNTIIYWWRLKEFRAVLLSVTKSSNVKHRVVPSSTVATIVI